MFAAKTVFQRVSGARILFACSALFGALACADAAPDNAGAAGTGIAGSNGTMMLPSSMTPGVTGGVGGGVIPTAGTGAVAGAAGIAGMAGTAGTAGMGPIETPDGGVVMNGDFIDLAPPMSTPLSVETATMLTPAPPAGWSWFPIENTFCRDGSGNGLFVRFTDSDKLLIYFEGGGACTTKGFCHFNPKNVNEILSGDGQTVLGTALAAAPGRQQPGVYSANVLSGIFDDANAANPYKGWNMVYVPYCTGDVHFGSNPAAMVPGVPEPQKLVGYLNTREFMSHVAPTFKDKISRFVVTGASAGSFGTALNFSMIADSFKGIQGDAILDSGAPFEDAYWPACLQQSWRDLFKLNDGLPADCPGCFAPDGGGMLKLADFLIDKHPTARVAAISSIHDEVIRLFFAPGQNNCATITTADPFEITVSQIVGGTIFPAADYEAGLMGLRSEYESTGRIATYYFAGSIATMHQHTFRARFYEPIVGGKSMAQFTTDFLAGTMAQVGP